MDVPSWSRLSFVGLSPTHFTVKFPFHCGVWIFSVGPLTVPTLPGVEAQQWPPVPTVAPFPQVQLASAALPPRAIPWSPY